MPSSNEAADCIAGASDPSRNDPGALAHRARGILSAQRGGGPVLRVSDAEWRDAVQAARDDLAGEIQGLSEEYRLPGTIHRIYNAGYHGAEAIASAVRAIEAGEQDTVTFVLCRHGARADDAEPGFLTYHVGYDRSWHAEASPVLGGQWRWCGEDGKPSGPWSSSLTLHDDAVSVAAALACALSSGLKNGWSIYRQPTLEQFVALKTDPLTRFFGDTTSEEDLGQDRRAPA
jgi:hypothetical protein